MENNKRILVTGAGGFIGGSIVEASYLSGYANVRAGIRQWSSATRIARFPVEIVFCDVLDREQIDNAMDGISHVIHCAVGDRTVTVEGTQNMLESALNHGVKRFVHVSTVDVYGHANREVDEASPLRYTGNQYGDSKIDAEKLCWKFYKKGVPVSIIRPAIVYGPFSKLWTIRFAERLRSGNWGIYKEYGDGICNLIYIDDLVSGIFLAASNERAIGEAFNIIGSETITWNQYFLKLNNAMGLPQLKEIRPTSSKINSAVLIPFRSSAKYVLSRYGDLVMKVYARYGTAKTIMKQAEKTMKTTPVMAELNLYSQRAHYSSKNARDTLGYKPQYDVDKGVAISVSWLEHHGFLS